MDDGGIDEGERVEFAEEFEVFGAGDEEFDGGEIVGVEGVGGGARHGDEPLAPTGGQGGGDRVAEDVGVVAVSAVVGAVLAEGLIEHDGGEFVERVGEEIGVVGGGKRGGGCAEIREGGEQRRGTKDEDGAVIGKGGGGVEQVLEGLEIHGDTGVASGRPTKGEQDFKGCSS